MAIQLSKALAFTAVGGLLAGLSACGGDQKQPDNAAGPAASGDAAAGTAAPAAKDCCKGQNSCKGKGGCHVDGKQECKTKNDCKGQGGCKSRTDC